MKTITVILLLTACTTSNAEISYRSSLIAQQDDNHYLTEAKPERHLFTSTPDYYNPDPKKHQIIDYSDIILMQIEDTTIDLKAINSHLNWSSSSSVTHELMSFSMDNQSYPLIMTDLPKPWVTHEPILSNFQQVENLPSNTTNNTNFYWLIPGVKQ